MPEHIEKIESAFVAVLAAQAWPAGFNTGLILSGESDTDKTGQCVICFTEDADQEEPPNTGNKWNTVTIELRTPVQKKTNTADQLGSHKASAVVLEQICLADNLKDLLSAAVPDFTVFGILDRLQARQQTPNFYSSAYTMRVYSAARDLSP
jgi:hypothetical protein